MRRGGGRMGRRKTLLLWVLCTVVPLSAIHGPGGSDSHYPMASPPKIEEMSPAMQEVIPSAQPSYPSDHVGVDHKWTRVIPPSIESQAPNLPLGSGPAKFPITSPVMSAAAPPKEISSYLSPDNPPHLKDSSLMISPAVHEVKYPSNTTNPPLTSEPSVSPAISPTPNESKNLSNTTHAPLESHPASSFVISPTPNDASNPSDTTPPLIARPRPSPVISPAVHEVKYPSNTTHSPLTSEPSMSPAISPTPNKSKNLSNTTTHAPLESHPASSFVISHTSNEASNPSDTTPSPLISHLSPSPVISPAVHEIKYPSNTTHPPLISEPSVSPAISPTPTESKNLSNTTHAPLESHPASSFVISSTPNEASNLSDTTPSPLISHPSLSPVISPAPHELKNPSSVTHAPVTSHPGSYPVISPAPNGVKNPLNTAPAPLTSYLSPSPVVSPVPHEVNNPSNITHAPVTSHPNSSPTISPVPDEVTNPSNTTPAPSTPQPSPPMTSPTKHELKNTSNTAPAPSISHHSPSPAMSPLLHQMKNSSNITPAPSTSHPSSFPMISPTPHEVENNSNTKHAPLTSHPSLPPVVSPKPHDAKNSPNGTYAHVAPHPQPPAGRLHSPASSPSTTIHQHTAKRSVGNPAPSPFSVLPPSSHHPVEGPVISTAPLHPPVPPKDRRRHHAPPLFVQGPSFSPIQAPFSSTVREGAPAPSPSSMIPSRRNESEPGPSPILSPSGPFSRRPTAPSPQPVWSLPPPTSSLGPVHSPVHSPSESFSRKPGAPSPHPVGRLPSPPPNYGPVHSPSESFSRKPGAPSPHPVWRLPSPPPNYGPVHSPVHSPSESFSRKPGAPSPHPVWRLPSPPPNYDCSSLTCSDPLANSPPGSPCICVLPIKVGLRLGVALYTFFPLVSELAQEIAAGIFMKQSQVRIMGANATDEEPEKTIVLIYLVPLGKYFDNTTAFLIYERFWHKQVVIEASYFGDYDVLYVHYPGLPPSPPAAPSGINVDNAAYGSDNNARTIHPLGVDVRKQKEKQLSGSLMAIIVLSSIMTLILFIGAAWLLVLKYRDHAHLPASTSQSLLPTLAKQSVAATGPMVYGSGPNSVSASFNSSIATYTGSAKTFTLAEIERATKKFDNSRIIGEGGFGRVYQGTIDDGTRVAVKVLKREDQQGGREFLAEVEMLSRLHHRNLVKLIGICTEDIHCLVYELIPNGSVESHLHGVDKETAPLDWNARVKVALGAARGLAYLHEDSSPRVIHRDFKSSNILLEHDFTPKVSDFGLARTAMDGGDEHISTRVMGTFGYVAPEYAMTGHLLVKSDVYSYGVVLLELLTGRKPVDMLQPPGQENLVTWARPLLTSMDGLVAIIDSSLGTDVPFDSVAKVAAIASMCVQPEVSHRPFMGEVVQALKLVCNESDEYRPSGSCSQEEISAQGTDVRISTELDLEARRGLSSSDIFSTSARFTKDASGSFRRHSSSGPLRTGRSTRFWQRDGGMSAGSMSEHGVAPRSMTSFEGHNKWP